MLLETEVERVLLLNGHNMIVKADNGNIQLTARAQVFSHNSLKAKLTEIVKQVKGVNKR